MDPALLAQLYNRLGQYPPPASVSDLIIYAISGPEALDAALTGTRPPQAAPPPPQHQTPAGAYLAAVTVEGFRGIGDPVTLSIPPGPGLTVVMGRNGSAKSSFAEAAELALTGDNHRWRGRSRVWSEGWRNLHHGNVRICVDVVVEGAKGATRIERRWAEGAELDAGVPSLDGKATTSDLGNLHWGAPLDLMRPFLSHNELGSMLDEGPTKLYDAVHTILGLGDITVLTQTLASARLTRERTIKEVAGELTAITAQLKALADAGDDRASPLMAALPSSPKNWRLDDAARRIEAAERPEPEGEGRASVLNSLTTLSVPAPEVIRANVAALREAASDAALSRGTDAARARIAARVLRDAIELHQHHRQTECPVCHRHGALDPAWLASAQLEARELEERAQSAESAHLRLTETLRTARSLLNPPPPALLRAADVGLDAAPLRTAWGEWLRAPTDDDGEAVAAHIESAYTALAAAAKNLRTDAQRHLTAYQSAWLDVVAQLRGWLVRANRAIAGQEHVPDLKAAEGWVRDAGMELRDERFQPIAADVHRYWDMLKQRSSVVLDAVTLAGSGNRRRVDIDVDIDGVESAALAVMSQGELNCLALSLFLPRACLPESPFRFVVIDDPVQAMDPAKVDGLVQVLSETSRTRQVIVFSHDERLTEAIRRLQVKAVVYAVSRGERSIVVVTEVQDPVNQLLADARAVALTEKLPVAAARVVPALCRQALEAACMEVVTRRRLLRGDSYADVDELRRSTRRLTPWLALALFDDASRGGDVLNSLANRYTGYAVDAVRWCQSGAHEARDGDLMAAVSRVDSLAQQLVLLK
ncbi:MAG: AAA family ATPase [Candidatus Dormibacteraeota bacterium]|nr:AAA family ATPase [Candidatus Dormibacteraeota bacterium]